MYTVRFFAFGIRKALESIWKPLEDEEEDGDGEDEDYDEKN